MKQLYYKLHSKLELELKVIIIVHSNFIRKSIMLTGGNDEEEDNMCWQRKLVNLEF